MTLGQQPVWEEKRQQRNIRPGVETASPPATRFLLQASGNRRLCEGGERAPGRRLSVWAAGRREKEGRQRTLLLPCPAGYNGDFLPAVTAHVLVSLVTCLGTCSGLRIFLPLPWPTALSACHPHGPGGSFKRKVGVQHCLLETLRSYPNSQLHSTRGSQGDVAGTHPWVQFPPRWAVPAPCCCEKLLLVAVGCHLSPEQL